MYKTILILLIGMSLLFSGCSFFDAEETNELSEEESPLDNDNQNMEQEESNVVKIIFNSDMEFMEMYGKYIKEVHPDIEFKIFSSPYNFGDYEQTMREYEQLIDKEGIDVVFIDEALYVKWSEEERLYGMDHFIIEDSFQLQDYNSNVIESLRTKDGTLYGLSPKFNIHAIYYNKSLFDQLALGYPNEQMTWDDIFDLAERIALKDGTYGIDYPYLFGLILELGRINGLDVVNENNTIDIDNEEWLKLWKRMKNLYRNDIIYDSGMIDYNAGPGGLYEKFLDGNAAMVITNNRFLYTLQQVEVPFEWNLSPEPIQLENSNESISFYHDVIVSIPANAGNIDAAWKVVEFINSSHFAQIILNEHPYELVSRMSVMQESDNKQFLEVFYQRRPSLSNSAYHLYTKNMHAMNLLSGLLFQEYRLILDDEKGLEEALRKISEKVEELMWEM